MKHDETCRVASHVDAGAGYRRIVLEAPAIAPETRPGQFVHVRVPALADTDLRRPFSVFDAHGGKIEILYKVVGRGTEAFAQTPPGAEVSVLGPLGRGFPAPAAGATAILVGGGYGVAPLHFLARDLARSGSAQRPVVFAGGRTAADLLAVEDFEAAGARCILATEDGSRGAKGFVTGPLDAALKEFRAAGRPFELYACGPDGLLKAVTERALELGVPGWISTDRHMVCGVGACFACIQKTRDASGGTVNSRCCVNGPVFKAAELVWD